MIKLVSDTIDKSDINSLVEWLSQDEIPKLTKGNITIEFEKKWSKKIGINHTTFVNSGSSAILLSLAALKESTMLKNMKIVLQKLMKVKIRIFHLFGMFGVVKIRSYQI